MDTSKTKQELSRKSLSIYLPLLLLVAVYGCFQLQIINLDLWNDEIYTLKEFVFTSVHTTLTDYHAPNNHVFFNLVNILLLKLMNVQDLHALMDSPYKLRLISFFYALITIVLVYLTGLKHFNKRIAIISLIILISTIPFYNSATQIRGYSMSTMFVAAFVFIFFNFLKNKKSISLFLMGILSTLLFYTIPTNIIFLSGIIVFSSMMILKEFILSNKTIAPFKLLNDSYTHILMVTLCGIAISLILYLPVISNVFANEYIDSHSHFSLHTIRQLFPEVITAFISNRIFLVLLFLTGLIFNFSYFMKWGHELFMIMTVFVTAFIVCFIQGGEIPDRIFVILAPLFCLAIAIGVDSFIDKFAKSILVSLALIILIFAYCTFTFKSELKKAYEIILADIKSSHRTQNLYVNYYIPRYEPQKVLREFKERYYNQNTIVVLHKCEPHDLPDYLQKFEVNYFPYTKLDSLLSKHGTVYVLSNHPNEVIDKGNYKSELLSKEYSYLNIIRLVAE